MAVMRYVRFVCTECGAEDTEKLFSNEQVPQALNCWKCHAGFNKQLATMLMENVGMFPVLEEAKNAKSARASAR